MATDGEIKGVDFSFARISAATLAANGIKHVFRYLANLPNGKVITKAERDDDVAHGITIHYNWETTAGRMTQGAAAGYADGAEAKRQITALGDPNAVVIYSLDEDPRAVDLRAVRAYAEAASYHTRVGVYGGAALIAASLDWPFVSERWQTEAWSGGFVNPHADYYQRVGHSWHIPGVADDAYDEDVIIHSGVTPTPPKPIPAPTEVDMLIIAQKDVGAFLCGATTKPIKLPDLQSIKAFEDAGVKIVFVGPAVYSAVSIAAA